MYGMLYVLQGMVVSSPQPPGSDVRITDASEERITDDGDRRVTDDEN
jgi:hypothetical protein